MNAREFVLSLADQLIEQGREVEIEENEESIRIYAKARTLSEYTIGAHAFRITGSSRWTFGAIRAYGLLSDTVEEKTRKRAHGFVRVYGRSYLRQEVTA